MKPNKILKSLAELSVASIDAAINSDPEKIKPGHPHAPKEPPPRIPPEALSQASEKRGYQRWGLNE